MMAFKARMQADIKAIMLLSIIALQAIMQAGIIAYKALMHDS